MKLNVDVEGRTGAPAEGDHMSEVKLPPLDVLADYVERSTHWREGGADRHAAKEALKALRADMLRLQAAHDHQYGVAGTLLREAERLEHNTRVLTNALWKACGDDEQSVSGCIESQGKLK